jgi:hypothetical protein
MPLQQVQGIHHEEIQEKKTSFVIPLLFKALTSDATG